MNQFLRTLLPVLALTFVAACGDKPETKEASTKSEREAAHKSVRKNAYVEGDDTSLASGYFNLEMNKPADWTLAEEKTAYELMGVGMDFVAGDDPDLQKTMSVAEKKNVVLFVISENPMGAAVEFNPSLMGLAENVKATPGVATGEDYFFHSKKLAAQANVPIEYAETYSKRNIGGVEFSAMDAKVTAPGAENVQQTYYATRHKDHVVVIIQSFATDEQKTALDGIVDSMKLGW